MDDNDQRFVVRLRYFESHLVGMLDGTKNHGVRPAGAYRDHLEAELAKVQRALASYGEVSTS